MDKKFLKLTLDKAQEAYKNGNSEVKKILVDLYGKEPFLTDIKDRVDSYESACEILGIPSLDIEDFDIYGDEAKRMFARHKITTGIKAINEGWKPDFDNESQYKWYNYLTNKLRGFASSSYYCYYGSSSGSDLYIVSSPKADVIAKVFREDYIAYLF